MYFFRYQEYADEIYRMMTGKINLPVTYLVGGICFAIIYIFQAIGLFIIAKREGIKWKWMAFVPIVNTFYLGVCGQKNKFFKIDAKTISLIAAVIELLLCVCYLLDCIGFAELYAANAIEVSSEPSEMSPLLYEVAAELKVGADVSSKLNWAFWYLQYANIFIGILEIVYLFAMVVTLNCFFQTYAARRYFIFTIASVFFPVQGILIFAVRNNKGMRYADYIRAAQERAYRQYRDQQNFYQNPYNQNPYSNNRPPYEGEQPQQPPQSEPRQNTQPDDPFSEFDSTKNDPFDEFKN